MEQLVKNWEESSILPLYLFNFYADYITGNKRMDESPARNKIARRNINMQMVYQYTSDMQMIPLLWQKQRRTKEPLDESKRGE